MAGSKKAKKSNARPKGFKPRGAREAEPNLFERLSNKKRFDVLGREPKGQGTRNVGQLRAAATEKVRAG